MGEDDKENGPGGVREGDETIDPILEASAQLERVGSFFGRVEAKLAFLFGMNGFLLAMLLVNLQAADLGVRFMVVTGSLAIGLLAGSFVELYRAWMPYLESDRPSLVYFAKIAELSESEFEGAFLKQSRGGYARDLANQVWRNSRVVNWKFRRVHLAFRLSALSLLPWTAFLIGSVIIHGKLPILP